MTDKEMWSAFCNEKGIAESTKYEAWAFGEAPDQLVQLVLEGKKTGTSSAYDVYELDASEPIPEEGAYSIILDSNNCAKAVIKTTKVSIIPFSEVTEEHARKEGEGDLSLAHWRKVHEEFFSWELEHVGLTFAPSCLVVCEEFEVLYR